MVRDDANTVAELDPLFANEPSLVHSDAAENVTRLRDNAGQSIAHRSITKTQMTVVVWRRNDGAANVQL